MTAAAPPGAARVWTRIGTDARRVSGDSLEDHSVRPPTVSRKQAASRPARPSAKGHRAPDKRTAILDGTARDHSRLTIGKLAKLADMSPDTLRFYEDEGILRPAHKTAAGYRLYGEEAVRRLGFIWHAQQCGMTLSEIRQLLEMRTDDRACCDDVRGLAAQKKLQLEQKIRTMQAMSKALSQLIDICTAGDRPLDDCPILAALESSIAKRDHTSR